MFSMLRNQGPLIEAAAARLGLKRMPAEAAPRLDPPDYVIIGFLV